MAVASNQLEEVRLRVIKRMAALLETETRNKIFGSYLTRLIRVSHEEVIQELERSLQLAGNSTLASSLQEILNECDRLDQCLDLLFNERQRQWDKSGAYVQALLDEFDETLTDLTSTLIEKDLLERQSRILEQIILSHENVTQWKEFVKDILVDFHAIFPFNFFYIAFAEDKNLSLYVYYLGSLSEQVKEQARHMLAQQMIDSLNVPSDVPLEIEEFVVKKNGVVDQIDGVRMITVAVPEHTPKLAGLLGVAYASINTLSAQEESVIRSILAVMVMVVGSSKALSRTLSELEYYSMHDPLTGLYNRRHVNAILDYEIGRSQRHHHEFSILLLDLDDFKDINDAYGHPTGDSALCGVAEVLRSHLRKGDLACRIGGDEFVVLLMETGRDGALKVASNIGMAMRSKSFIAANEKQFHLTVSIGIVTYPHDSENVTELLASIDLAMYRAKELGKDGAFTVEALGREHITESLGKRDLSEKLRIALQENRILPFYQPIIDCSNGEIFAYETLARLVEPDGELIVAGSFINTLEKYSLSRRLDRAIINSALEYKSRHINNIDQRTKLFINLSAQEIQGRNILGYVEELCTQFNIPPSCIVFEILERDAISDMSNMRKFLSSLRGRGFGFALDDFGSGYNSFHYLRELHFDYVKIDGTFVRNILHSKIDFALVQNLSNLCQDIGIRTVAEFVENQETLDAVKAMGINYAQGHFIGMPGISMKLPTMQLIGKKAGA